MDGRKRFGWVLPLFQTLCFIGTIPILLATLGVFDGCSTGPEPGPLTPAARALGPPERGEARVEIPAEGVVSYRNGLNELRVLMPAGTTLAALTEWYEHYLTPGRDAPGLTWLFEDNAPPPGLYSNWTWCTTGDVRSTVDVGIGEQDVPGADRVFVYIDHHYGYSTACY